MAKKITIIVLAVLIVAAAVVGAIFYFNGSKPTSDTGVNSQTTVPEEQFMDEDQSDQDYIIDDEPETTESTESEDPLDALTDLSKNTDDITTTSFTIDKIVDITTDQEVAARVVFGSDFNIYDNFIKFNSDDTFEMYLSGYLDKTTSGVYTENNDVVYVEFEDGTAAEYEISRDENNIIIYVMVTYGDYNIYFA